MDKAPFERLHEARRRDGATYTCKDGVRLRCGYEVFELEVKITWKMGLRGTLTAPKNGILLRPGKSPIVVINRTLTSRDMKEITIGGPSKTYAFPSTTTIVGEDAF